MRVNRDLKKCLIFCSATAVLVLICFFAVTAFSSSILTEPLTEPKWIGINEFRGGVNLRWFRVQGAVQYLVQRRVGEKGEITDLALVSNPVYDDFMITPGQVYFYRIFPIDRSGESGPTSVEKFFRPLYVSDTGTGIIAVIGSKGEIIQDVGGLGSAPWQFEVLLSKVVDGDVYLYAVDECRDANSSLQEPNR